MRYIAILSLFTIYSITLLIVNVSNLFKRQRTAHHRIIINGTFHNPNWFHAHIEPIAMSGYGEVVLVTDEPLADLDNLVYECPPAILNKLFTRAGAKFIWTLWIGHKKPADIFIGYHIFPSSITALIAASLYGAKSCYQVTSGQLELEGGGYAAENKLLSALQSPSKAIEGLVNKIINKFDLVVVRGSNAKKYILDTDYAKRLEVITGSVLTDIKYMQKDRKVDVVFVGRLAEYKQPELFIDIIANVVRDIPGLRVKIAGDGPLMHSLQERVRTNNLENNIEFLGKVKDIPTLLGNSKILVLTSRWEGVSIAMLEAMALGVVPVVSNVGDLGDYVESDVTGYIFESDHLQEFRRAIVSTLQDNERWSRLSESARQKVVQTSDRNVLAERWGSLIDRVVASK